MSLPTQAIGYLLVYTLGPRLHYYQLLFLYVPAPVISLACQIWIPESPYFCMSKGRSNQAIQTVNFLRRGISSNAAELIVQQIQNEVSTEASDQSDWFSLISEEANFRSFCQAVGFVSLEHLSGSSLVLMTLQPLLIKSNALSNSYAVVIGTSMFLVVAFVPPLVKKFDYKKLLVCCSIGMAIAMLVMGIHFLTLDLETGISSPNLSFIPLGCVLLYVTSYQIGFATTKGTVVNKMFSPEFITLGSSLVFSVSFFSSFLVSYIYYPLVDTLGTVAVMWTFTFFSSITAVYVIYVMPKSISLYSSTTQK